MRVSLMEVDSEVLARTVLSLDQCSGDEDVQATELAYVQAHHPSYVVVKLPLEDTVGIHRFEDAGFRLIETQLRLRLRLRKAFDVRDLPYRFERVLTEEALEPVLQIAGEAFTADRFSADPRIPSDTSGRRYRRYVEQSMKAPDERVYRLVNAVSGEVVAFKTHRVLGPGEIQLLLGGVKTGYRSAGIGAINEYFEFNLLREEGVRSLVTHVSAKNYPILDLEVSGLGFRVEAAFAVLRKVYG